MSDRHIARQWWAGGRLSPRARLGTAVVAGLLAVVTLLVWNSPQNPVEAQALTSTQARELAAQVAALQGELTDTRNTLTAREDELAALHASQDKAASERAAAELRSQAQRAAAAEQEEAARTKTYQDKAAAERAAAAARGRFSWASERADEAARAKAAAQARQRAADGRAEFYQGLAAQRLAATVAAQKAAADAEAKARDAEARAEAANPTPTPQPLPSAPSLAQLIHPSTRQFGLYTAQSPFNWAGWDDVVAKVGVRPTIAGYFQGWDKPFRSDAVVRSWRKGAMPLLSWESIDSSAGNDQAIDPAYSLPRIIDGTYDDYLRTYARDVVALGLPLAIRLDHEMNGSWYPWAERDWGGGFQNGNHKGDYVKMWRHVHDIFEQEGANAYVLWIWAPNIVNRLPSYARSSSWYMKTLYPGDAYVDWVGLSGYFRPPYASDQTPTFSYTFDRSLAQLREVAPGKPILLAEVGASEIGDQKPEWVTSFFDAFADPRYDDIVGLAWFHHAITTYSGGTRVTNDWRIDSRRDSLQAFVDGITDPAAGFVGGSAAAASAPSATATPSPSPAPTASPTPTPSPTPTASPAPTPSSAPTSSPTPDPSPDPGPTSGSSPSPSPTGEAIESSPPTSTTRPSSDPTTTAPPSSQGEP
ncbi:MAG: hypothetical protein KQH57_17595 [Actinomycetales bacterium]|nr:hypothetical protein [Actinomycetales bacterium]